MQQIDVTIFIKALNEQIIGHESIRYYYLKSLPTSDAVWASEPYTKFTS